MDVAALAQTLISPSLASAIALIFGGCCALITFAQFLGVSFGGFCLFSLSHAGRQAVWAHKVPLLEYCKIVGFHFAVSVLNNFAFAYHISIPVHIILRSGGSIVTMLLGFLFLDRRYTYRQISAVLLVTLGVIVATISGNPAAKQETDGETGITSTFVIGVLLMVVSQVLASGTGLYLERTFRVFSPSWRETLFYTHLLALPFFLPFYGSISSQYSTLVDSGPIFEDENFITTQLIDYNPPALLVNLVLNVLTQLVCVCGVNQLASTTTALSVSIVLNLRKFTSLIISFVLFGHKIDVGVMTGAVFVFLGALWYSQEASHIKDKREVKNSSINLADMNPESPAKRKVYGTPILEKGCFEDSSRSHRRLSLSTHVED